jgi:hypothetical protein
MAIPTSGPQFDFSMFPRKYWGEALGGVGADIAGALRWKREQERQEEADRQKAKFENDQNANSLFGKQEQEREHKLHEAQSQAGLRGGLAKNLSALLGQGRTDEAEATAKASAFEVGDTGKTAGVGLKRMLQGPGDQLLPYADLPAAAPGGPAPAPTSQGQILSRFLGAQPKPESLEPPAFGQDPQEPAPDMARAAAGLSSMGGQASLLQTAGGAADQYRQAQDQYQASQQQSDADRQKQQQEHDKAVRWQMSFPSGETQTIDPNQAKAGARAEADDRASQLEAAAVREANPDTRAAMIRQASLIRAQVSNADKAPITNMAGQEDSQDFKRERDERNQLTREEQLRKAALAGAHRTASQVEFDKYKAEQKRIQAASAYEPVVQNVLHKYGFEKVQDQQTALSDLFNLAGDAEANPAAYTLLGGRYAKFAQGAGVLSDSDMRQFWTNIGGKLGFFDAAGNVDLARTVNSFKAAMTGTGDPAFLGKIKGSLDTLEKTINGRSNQIGHSIETVLRGKGADDQTVDSYLGTYAPLYQMHGPGTRGDTGNESITHPDAPPTHRRPRAAPAAPPAAASAGTRPPSSAFEYARAHPGDPKSQAFTARWGATP